MAFCLEVPDSQKLFVHEEDSESFFWTEKTLKQDFDDTWKSGYYSPSGSEDSFCVPDVDSSRSSYEDMPSNQPRYDNPTPSNPLLAHAAVDAYKWQTKNPEMWNQLDVSFWIQHVAEKLRLPNFNAATFGAVEGSTLCKMQMDQFQELDPSFGSTIYMEFIQLINSYQEQQQPFLCYRPAPQEYMPGQPTQDQMTSIDRYIQHISFDKDDTFPSLPPFESLMKPLKPVKIEEPKVEPISDEESSDSSPPPSPPSTTPAPPKSRRGRSKGKLWEFVLNLLLDEKTNPNIIKWEDRSKGVFRIVRSDQVAKLWGIRKGNPTMTYEKMSRAMRYYYRKKILERIDGRRLVYKFGPNSRGW